MRRSATYLLALLALAWVLPVACNTSGCLDNRNAIPLAQFCDGSGKAIVVDKLQISGVDAPNDSILKSVNTKTQQVYLPMRSAQSSTAWCFSYKWEELDFPEYNDTITFWYESIPYFASEECGASYRYRITRMEVTDHLIERVEILDSLITNVDKTYLNIYFRTADDEPESQP